MASKTKNSKAKKNRQNSKQTNSPLAKEITLLAIIIFSLLALLSLFGMCGPVGNLIGSLLFGLFGATAYIFRWHFPSEAVFLSPIRNDRKYGARLFILPSFTYVYVVSFSGWSILKYQT